MALRRPPLLPLELILVVKSFVPISDLRTHVCLYKAHPRIAALYDSEEYPDDFWERACWHSGIGALGKDNLWAEHCWRDIALEVIERDGFCTHPQCGEALLEYNAERIGYVQEDYDIKPLSIFSRWKDGLSDLDSFAGSDSGEDDDGENPMISMHRALLRTAFRTESSDGYYGVRDEAQLRPVTDAEKAYKGSVLLKDHPLLERSFATDVPTSILLLSELSRWGLGPGIVRKGTGVTVFDVMAALHSKLDQKFDDYEREQVAEELSDYDLPDGWTQEDAYAKFRTLRDVFAVCRLTEFYYDGTVIDRGPLFSLTFCGN
ncbi:hypothetical protein OH77DRAFT_1251173 [Trametes cingulata]|nr:hypothetical protein OH77DRAFT_1251173 [Trametes cingulata]